MPRAGKVPIKFQVPNTFTVTINVPICEFSVSQFKGFVRTVFRGKSPFSKNHNSGQGLKIIFPYGFLHLFYISARSLKIAKAVFGPPVGCDLIN